MSNPIDRAAAAVVGAYQAGRSVLTALRMLTRPEVRQDIEHAGDFAKLALALREDVNRVIGVATRTQHHLDSMNHEADLRDEFRGEQIDALISDVHDLKIESRRRAEVLAGGSWSHYRVVEGGQA